MRIIDADALPVKFDGHTVGVWKKDLDAAPTIDAEPVVRCKDCKHCMDRKTYLRCVRYGFNAGHEVKPTDFCSYGERREKDG